MRSVAFTVLLMTFAVAPGQLGVALGAQAAPTQAITETGTLLSEAPLFLLPDATRTPLATLPTGTAVRVLDKEGDWYKVIYHDAFLGDRTGYIAASNIRFLPAPPPSEAAADTATRSTPATPQDNTSRPPRRGAASHASWTGRGYISVNGTYQITSNAFTTTTTFSQNVETGSVTTTHNLARPPVLDIAAAGRVWRNLALGAAVTWLSQTEDAALSASVPHPFLFNAPRTVTGQVSDLPRQELALHVDAAWVVPAGRRTQVAIFGGPSYFHVKQGLVSDVITSSVYPYDTATFVGATTVKDWKSQLGFNVGLDVNARVWKYVGVGAIVRYSRASLQFPVGSGPDATVRAGGLQVGGGVRFNF